MIVEHPELITRDHIEAESNAEVRRVMIDRFGAERYIVESGAKQIAKDPYGILWRKEVPDDEPLVMVEVLNSTPEIDGSLSTKEALAKFHRDTPVCHDGMMMPLSQAPDCLRFKKYMLRVPPDMKSAKQACAQSFAMTEEEYVLQFQS